MDDTRDHDPLADAAEHAAAGGPRHERRDAAKHRQQILAAARALFLERGVDATCMAEVARAAGVGQGTLYRRYAHKGELCSDLLAANTQALRAGVEAYLAAAAEQPALARLETVLLRMAAFNEENASLLGAIDDAACGRRRTAGYASPLYVWLRQIVVRLLGCASARGETGPLDVDAAADLVLAPLAIDLHLYQRRVLGHPPERSAAALRQLLFDGLRARPRQ